MDEQFVSIGKAAKMLGMSIDGLRKWEREGRLIPVRRRYRVADLRALMQDAPGVARSMSINSNHANRIHNIWYRFQKLWNIL